MKPDADVLQLADENDGWVDFESQAVVDGQVQFTSFSRHWTGSGWQDEESRPAHTALAVRAHAAISKPISIQSLEVQHPNSPGTRVLANPTGAAALSKTTAASTAATVAASSDYSLPCTWLQDTSYYAYTVVGELHIGKDETASWLYGADKTSDSDIGVGYNYGSGFSISGTLHVGNASSTLAGVQDHPANWKHQIKTEFLYVRYKWINDGTCGGTSGTTYYKVSPASWVAGYEAGADLSQYNCDNATSAAKQNYGDHGVFSRTSADAYTYGGAVSVGGATLSSQNGFSKHVTVSYKMGSNSTHYLCGTNNQKPALSKIIYAS